MKKLTLFLFFAIIFSNYAFAQTGRIKCISFKEIHRNSGTWEAWPDYWTTYASQGRLNPTIQITTAQVLQSGNVYRVSLFVGGETKADFYVTFDSDKTASVRRDWNNDYINCYVDKNGDYVYTVGVSLESLAKDPTSWSDNADSQLYFWTFSYDYAVVVR